MLMKRWLIHWVWRARTVVLLKILMRLVMLMLWMVTLLLAKDLWEGMQHIQSFPVIFSIAKPQINLQLSMRLVKPQMG